MRNNAPWHGLSSPCEQFDRAGKPIPRWANHARVLRCLLAMAAILLVPCALAETPEEALRRADRLEKEGSLTTAQEIYEGFLKTHADHVQAFDVEYRLAIVFDNKGEPDTAIARFQSVLAKSKDKPFKHRADAFMSLGKLQGSLNRHEDAIATLTAFLDEGAGLYEDEAYNLCGGYHAIAGNFDKAAAMFNILKRRNGSRFAPEAGYKLAVIWLKAGKIDLATVAVEDFARSNPSHARTPQLFLKVARDYYDNKDYRKAIAICEQVRNRFSKSPEAGKAIYLSALCAKAAGQYAAAAKSLTDLAARYAATQRDLAVEALFEAAQINHKQLKEIDAAMELYQQAASAAQDAKSERQQKVREYCYFQMAEHAFSQESWQAALDLYLTLHKISPDLDVNGRIIQCRSKLNADGKIELGVASVADVEFLKGRIADNPGTLLAAQGEVVLLDRELDIELAKRGDGRWKKIDSIVAAFAKLLESYPAKLLDEDMLRAYIYKRMAYADGSVLLEQKPPGDAAERLARAVESCEKGLALAANAAHKIELLENLARFAHHCGDDSKAFGTYKLLHGLALDADEDETAAPIEYIKSMAGLAKTPDLIDEVVAILEKNLRVAPAGSATARDAKFYLADLYYLKRRYSEAAAAYKGFIKAYGPEQDGEGEISALAQKSAPQGEAAGQLYDAGIRIAHCWRAQGNPGNTLKAYAWVARNQAQGNPHLAEAWYHTASGLPQNSPEAKGKKARTLWEQLVNTSFDFGSKVYESSFRPWVRNRTVGANADRYVRIAILKSGELFSLAGQHETAVEVFSEYLKLNTAADQPGQKSTAPKRDENYFIARYALGRELIKIGDYDRLAEIFRAYLDGDRDDRFRASGLMLLGHYATKAELFDDAGDAYATLLDEFGDANPLDEKGEPIPIPKTQWLRPGSNWDGIRQPAPEKFDAGSIRFALGYMFRKGSNAPMCIKSLRPFLDDVSLSENKSRQQALLMLGRSYVEVRDQAAAVTAFEVLVQNYPSFAAVEEASVDLALAAWQVKNWTVLERNYQNFLTRYADSDRRPYLDLYQALGAVEQGQVKPGTTKLRDLASADTYEDVKADAHYHLGVFSLAAKPPDLKSAMQRFKSSVDAFPKAPALLEAGLCAAKLEDWKLASGYLDRLLREFPNAEPEILKQAREALRLVAKASAGN